MKPQNHPLPYDRIDSLSRTHGDSFFVLDGRKFADNFKSLHNAFSDHYDAVHIGYSYKTNYTPDLCRIAHKLGGYAEVVSEMEFAHAKRLGVPLDRIIFNGPVKAKWAFEEAALGGSTLNLDSMRDMLMLLDVAQANPDTRIEIVLRCNFAIGDDISRFGMDVDGDEFARALTMIVDAPNLGLKGLHCHFPDRDLDSFRRRVEGMLELVARIFPNQPPDTLNIGGGFFSTLPHTIRLKLTAEPPTFEDYGRVVGGMLARAFQGKKKPLLFIEPGTAVAADTQWFYTRVLSTKAVRGKRFATVAGSVFDISPNAKSRDLPVTAVTAAHGVASASYDIVGYTCIEKDILSEGFEAELMPGDFVCYGNVGSYSVVMRPPFILPSNPILFDAGDGGLKLIKRRQSNEDVFRHFE